MSTSVSDNIQSIWYTRCPVPTPLGIAAHLGWLDDEFARDGITVRSLQETQHAAQRASHIDHTLDNSFRQGGSIPALWARSAGADTRVIALTWVDEAQAIVALPDSGIRTAKDLRGRRVGLPKRAGERIDIFRAAALRGFVSVLELEGLSARDVELVDVAAASVREPADGGALPAATFSNPGSVSSRRLYSAEIAALVRGEVDAIYVKGSLGLESAYLIGARIVVDIGFHPEPKVRINNGSPRPLTVNAATLDNHPDIVSRFLARVIDVDGWAREHKQEVLGYLGRETGSGDDWLRLAYGDDVHQRLRTDLDDTSIAALDDFKGFLVEWGFLPADFDIHAWIDPGALAQSHRYVASSSGLRR
ncbi:ABC transporter substrate-binding protein [Paraburkholderia sp.]|uniref:ABC transporter substrate-binding protein n=1 Tax=Paraburkholderia sp. TaxID=1926495 RepID=UPI002D41D911|nr:ABC transporter substrate-binding protein [Paraburkholderia sp.]HZZ05368.1 ABC transporter substrate-binding protein [Paraburkholderia sp.]